MSTVLVTGNKGFIGKNLVSTLQNEFGQQVITFDQDIFESTNWIDAINDTLESNRPSTIFHVGACSDTQETDSQFMFERNFESTKILVDWSKQNEIPLVYSSSAANYGTNGSYPSNLYGWSKYAAELYVASNWGISLRYFNVFGPGEEQKGKMASVFFQAHLLKSRGQEIGIFPGKPQRDFVFVDDIVAANIYAEDSFKDNNQGVFEVGTGEAHTFEDGLNHLKLPFFYVSEDQIPIGYQYLTCAESTRFMPGWHPKFTFYEGLDKYKKHLQGFHDNSRQSG